MLIEKSNRAEDMTVVVSTCDKYMDLLIPFSYFFRKYWEDCPYSVVVSAESECESNMKWIFNKVYFWGTTMSWAERLKKTVEQTNTPYVFLILDDFFISGHVSQEKIDKYINIMKKAGGVHYRMIPKPRPDIRVSESFGEYSKGKAYRISAQVAIWDRNYLIDLLDLLGESALWNFERQGSFLSNQLKGRSFSVYEQTFPYVEIICGGRWLKQGLQFCKEEGYELKREVRDKEPDWYLFYRKCRGFLFDLNPTFFTKLKMTVDKRKGIKS